MNVSTVMTGQVRACRPDDTLEAAARIMWDHDCGCVPVVHEGRVVGMLTDRDVCMAAYLRGARLGELRVRDSMSKTLHTCSPDDPVDAAEKIMGDHKVHRLAVVDADGALRGVLSLNDIARGYRAKRKGAGVAATDIAATLAAICERRVPGREAA